VDAPFGPFGDSANLDASFSSPYLQLSCLFYLFLLVPRLLAGITLVVWLIVLHKITTAVGGGVSVAKTQLGRL
jgi:hypothetical protein